jgi:hypothetical protein
LTEARKIMNVDEVLSQVNEESCKADKELLGELK